MNEVLMLVIGGLVSGLVQLCKKYFPAVHPLYMIALLSLVAGGLYVTFSNLGLLTPNLIISFGMVAAWSQLVYNVIKQFVKK